MTGYYGYIFGLIPLTLLGITGTLTVVGLQSTTAIPMAMGAATLLTGHALFANGPSSPSPSRLNEYAGPDAAGAPFPSVPDAD